MPLKKNRQKRTRNSLALAISAVACSRIHLFKENPPLRLKVKSHQKKLKPLQGANGELKMKRISGLGTKRRYQVVLHQKVLVRFEIAILTGSHLRSERNQKMETTAMYRK